MDQENRATKYRKNISQVDVLNVKNVTNGDVYFSRATLVDVSPTGLLLRVERENILALGLRSTLTLSTIIGESVGFTIEIMDTYIEGLITRTKLEGHGTFVVAVDFREDAPEYWRQCFVDLLPDGQNGGGSDESYPPESDEEGETDPDQDPEDDEGLVD